MCIKHHLSSHKILSESFWEKQILLRQQSAKQNAETKRGKYIIQTDIRTNYANKNG